MIDLSKHGAYDQNEHVIAYYAARRDFTSARFQRFWQTVKR